MEYQIRALLCSNTTELFAENTVLFNDVADLEGVLDRQKARA